MEAGDWLRKVWEACERTLEALRGQTERGCGAGLRRVLGNFLRACVFGESCWELDGINDGWMRGI